MDPFPTGSIEVIVGSMFSGKTEELIRRVTRAAYAKQRIMVFKSATDTRNADDVIASHSKVVIKATRAADVDEMRTLVHPETQVVGIDEGQFLKGGLIDFAQEQRDAGRRIIIAGLDMDYRGEPFHPMPHLMAIADELTKVRAICTVCGRAATFSQRIVKHEGVLLIGDKDEYEARCRPHFDPNKFE